MSESDVDLGLKDIRFLSVIKEVNENPDKYEDVHEYQGAVPATVSAVQEVSGLTRDEAQYRMRKGKSKRGFTEEDGVGYIVVYDAEILETGEFGPKSAELTQKGEEALEQAKRRFARRLDGDNEQIFAGVSDDELAKIKARQEELDDRIDSIEEDLSRLSEQLGGVSREIEGLKQSDMGALSPEVADHLETMIRVYPTMYQALSQVLGLNIGRLEETKELTPAEREEFQRTVLETLVESQK